MSQIGLCADSAEGIPMPGGICGEAIIDTPNGRVSLHTLRAGDLVETLDTGAQPVLAMLRRDRINSPIGPVLAVASGVLGATSELRLCPNQLILLKGWLVAALFSDPQVLVRADCLENGVHVRRDIVEGAFWAPVFAKPQAIRCNGVWMACAGRALDTPFCRHLSPDEARSVGESGLFTRRPGEVHARHTAGINRHAS